MASKLKVLRWTLCIFSIFDIIISVAILILASYFAVYCEVDGIYDAITNKVTETQMEFFYDALKECGYAHETSIPSTDMICGRFSLEVLPLIVISNAFNIIAAGFIPTLPKKSGYNVHDGKHRTSGLYQHRSAFRTLAIVVFGTLFAITFGVYSLLQYTHPRMCWLNYSLVNSEKTDTQLIWKIVISILLAIYKPLELLIILKYGNELVNEASVFDEDPPAGSATLNLAAQLEGDSQSETNIKRIQLEREHIAGLPEPVAE